MLVKFQNKKGVYSFGGGVGGCFDSFLCLFSKKTGNNFGDPQGSNIMSIGLDSLFWVKYSPATPLVDIQLQSLFLLYCYMFCFYRCCGKSILLILT